MNDLSRLDPNSEIGSALAIAQIAADSRLYKLNVPQAAMQILAGRELGLGPVASIRGVHLVQGQTVLDYTVLAALVEASGTYEVETTPIRNAAGETIGFEWDRDHCSLDFYKRSPDGTRRLIGQSLFDRSDAELAKLTGKENWKKHPKAMYMARAMSQGVRAHCPSVTMGSAYVPGEIPGSDDSEPVQIKPQRKIEPRTIDVPSRPEATQVAPRPESYEETPAPRSAPTAKIKRAKRATASPELVKLAKRIAGRLPSGGLSGKLFMVDGADELERLVEAAKAAEPTLVGLAIADARRQAWECETCFDRLPCSASAGCGGTRRAPEVKVATKASKPLSAKEQARAMLEAEEALDEEEAAYGLEEAEEAEEPLGDAAEELSPLQLLLGAKAEATALARHLPPERFARARAAIDCAQDLQQLATVRARIQAGLVQIEDEAAASGDPGGLA